MKSLFLVIAAIALTGTFGSSWELKNLHNASSIRAGSEEYRLSNVTLPRRYDIKLIPYLDNNVFTFDGQVEIEIETGPTFTINLHIDQLDINNLIITSSENLVPEISERVYNEELNFYTITFATLLFPGNYVIDINYTGQLRDDLTGFYRNYYNTTSGQIRWYASSFFAPIYARRAFPCFDEPGFKARFDISIAHWANQTAISNALTESVSAPDSTIGNRVWTRFQTTPLMSTYIIAFIVSDFEHVSNNAGNFRIWSRPEAIETASHSLDGISLLNQLSTYTGINYETFISKMDQVALPSMAVTAMENWGLITYREAWLLWQDDESTTRNRQNIETIGAHEFAHQWFGNLVTPEWWKYVWLSEGFASYFEYYTAAQVNPNWRLMEQFTVQMCHPVLLADSLDTSRSMNQDVYSPAEVTSALDIISYNKGACVLRMLSNILGETVFRTGLQIYQNNNSYGTGNPDELWDALTLADESSSDSILLTHVHVKQVMDTWTNQKGYPVVTVTRNYTSFTQVIAQERFLLNGRGSSNDTTEYRWWIPITFVSQASPDFSITSINNWVRAQDESVLIAGFQPTDWVIYNSQQIGFYRVNYDDQNWNLIATYLQTSNFTNIPPINRAALIDDAFNLARAGYLNYTVAFSVMQYLSQETDYIPWAAAFNTYAFLQRMLAHSPNYSNLQNYLFSRVAPIHSSLGYVIQENDEHVTSFLRAESHSWACRMGCPGCFTQSHLLMQNFYNSENNIPIHADLRAFAYCEGLRNASADIWNFMWQRYLSTDLDGEQNMIISGLGCSLDKDLLNRYLSFSIIENSGIRSHHRVNIFNSVYLGSPFNVDLALEFLLTNINEVTVWYGGPVVIGNLLRNIAAHLVTENQLVPLRTFISEQNNTSAEIVSAIENALIIAGENIAWLNIYEDDIFRGISMAQGAGNSLIAFSPILLLIISIILNSTG